MMATNKNKSVILKPRLTKTTAKSEIPTIPKELMILLPAITAATYLGGAFFCIRALRGTTYMPPIKAKANRLTQIKNPLGNNKNLPKVKGSAGVTNPTDSI